MEETKLQNSKKMIMPDDVTEIETSVDKSRLIEMTCISHRDHKTTKRHLKITAKGKICLM